MTLIRIAAEFVTGGDLGATGAPLSARPGKRILGYAVAHSMTMYKYTVSKLRAGEVRPLLSFGAVGITADREGH